MDSTVFAQAFTTNVCVSSVPISDFQPVGHLTITETGSSTKIIDQDISISSPTGMNQLQLLKKLFQVSGSVSCDFKFDGVMPNQVMRASCVQVSSSNPNMCDKGRAATVKVKIG